MFLSRLNDNGMHNSPILYTFIKSSNKNNPVNIEDTN